MHNLPFVIRHFLKSKNLRIVNLLGLALLFSCMFISYMYVKRELSFDKFYSKSDRIARMTVSYDGQLADGRIHGSTFDQVLKNRSEIETVLKLSKIDTAVLKYREKKQIVTDLYFSSENLFQVLDIPLLKGDCKIALISPKSVIISEKLAYQIFGKIDIIGEKIELSGRRFQDMICSVSGVFKDMPDNTHFHTDIIVRETNFDNSFAYNYLLLTNDQDYLQLEKKITDNFLQDNPETSNLKIEFIAMTDIHLHSHVLKDMEPNGNVNYIYLIVGANILLFIIVMFNLWLNSTVIFSYNKRYYQLLRLNGASSVDIAKNEFNVAFWLVIISLFIGKLISIFVANYFSISFDYISVIEEAISLLVFLFVAVFVSLLPVLSNLASTFFFNDRIDLRVSRFSFSNVRYMLITQYSIVVFIIMIALGINNQIALIRNTQIGATDYNIIGFEEQPEEVIKNYSLLKNELLKHPEIESVTAAMQLPGSAVRDMVEGAVAGQELIYLPVLVIGEDFFPFYGIKPLAGDLFSPLKMNLKEEEDITFKRIDENIFSNQKEDVILNQKALQSFGFNSPAEAIGKEIRIEHGMLDYTQSGIICGVVENFTYTNVYEDHIPMIILQCNMFMNCFMVKLKPGKEAQGMQTLNAVWSKVNSDYPINYKFLSDTYNLIYKSELNAARSIKFFSVVCLLITILGLFIFMEFMIKSRTKEIGIRKVNGATHWEIIKMLNFSLIKWIFLSISIAIPISWFIMNKWLENFAFKANLDWWIFIIASVFVISISLITVSLQSWKASRLNPIESIKKE